MKLIHLSDLHLGKRLNEFSMLEDQAYILRQIIDIIDREQPDGVIIAGDLYDKSLPPAEAVSLLDDFLVQLASRKVEVYLISGNHDSAERIAFGGRLMEESGIHFSPVYHGMVKPITFTDRHGYVDIYLLPFLKPVHVRQCFPEEEISSYTDALSVAISHMELDLSHRNVLVTHQFVTGAVRSESEEISVGGTDNVDCAVFDPFDYVALGHLHRPQSVGRETVRYCGTPLKYSFSEAGHEKSVTVVELGEKGAVTVSAVPLTPKRELRELRGTFAQLCEKLFYEGTTYPEDYLHITLTDENEILNGIGKLRALYPNIMRLDYDNTRTRTSYAATGGDEAENRSPMELFAELFRLLNGSPMSEGQRDYMERLLEEIEEGRA